MTLTAEFLTFLTFTAVMMVHHCKAALPPPTDLSYEWVDAFTVNVSWKKPSGLQDGDIWYKYRLEHTKSYGCVRWRNFSATLLTKEMFSGSWTYHVWTVDHCESQSESTKEPIIIQTPKPRAEVKDVKCIITRTNKEMNCSWTPGNRPLKLSYRICGRTKELLKPLTECHRPYAGAGRKGCYLTADGVKNDICVSFETDTGLSTFTIAPMIDPPVLSVGIKGDDLKLSWVHPEFGEGCSWTYTVCYKKCNHSEECRDYPSKGEPVFMPYDKSCKYEFQSRVKTDHYCKTVFSERGEVVSIGTDEPADKTLSVVAIVLPVILSVCIFLSCYCFRRHSSIICPVIPDPSAIFKEMMMNGNHNHMETTTGSLYTPVPEPIESCKVDPVTDNTVVPMNS